jgi:NADPH:quinone reductase-like Zn-dependent oxidoreductase
MGGSVAREVDLGRVLRQRLEIIGTAMRVREADERRALVARFTTEVLPAFTDGTLRPVVDRTMAAAEWDAAYAALASNATFGKVVLQWG